MAPEKDKDWKVIHRKHKPRRTSQSRPQPTAHHGDDRQLKGSTLTLKQFSDASTPSPAELQDIETTYNNLREKWRSSEGCRSLEAIVRDSAASHHPIDHAVCLGNGPLHAPDSSWTRRRTANVQTAAFLTIVELLAEITNTPIRCVFQEPMYSAADRKFITESLGHTVVDDPAAFDSVTNSSLVWGVHMYHSDYRRALEPAEPAMFVGTSWSTWDKLPDAGDMSFRASLEKVESMHTGDEYDIYDFPADGSYHTFSETAIYWKKRPSESERPETLSKAPRV